MFWKKWHNNLIAQTIWKTLKITPIYINHPLITMSSSGDQRQRQMEEAQDWT